MKTLTVFTPAYNRAHTIGRTYESLCRQTCKDFEWLVIDDGSSDNTRELVEQWMALDNGFEIKYVWKENGGLHTGYNKAIELAETEICVCIDSDDWMPDDAVDIIVSYWERHRNEDIAGFVGKDFLADSTQMGKDFPEDGIMHLVELQLHKKWRPDCKPVMRVDLLKLVAPQPSFKGEKNFNPYYMMLMIDQMYPFRFINNNLCFVDYQPTGMAANIYNQYFNSPNSFVELRRLYVTLKYTTLKWRLWQYVHLVAECKIAGKNPFKETGINRFCVLLVYPIGLMLYHYMCYKKNQLK